MILLIKCISRLLAMLPLSAALALGRFAGWVFGSIVRHHRHDAFHALRLAFPEKIEFEVRGIVNRMYANLGMSAVETLRLPYCSDSYVEENIEFKGVDVLDRELEKGKGILVLTAHLDNWEMVSILAPRFFPSDCYVIAKQIKSRIGQQYMTWNREVFGLNILPAKKSYRSCLKALKANSMIGFVVDQNMIRREGEFVEFFGRPACSTLGLAHLAARSGASVVPMLSVRKDGGRHEMTFMEPLEAPAGSDKESLIEATQRYTNIIEEAIRRHPDQWIWIHRRWNTTPEDV